MKIEEIVCDMCKTKKGSSNGWFKIQMSQVSFTIVHYGTLIAGDFDVCGLTCAAKVLSEFIQPAVEAQ